MILPIIRKSTIDLRTGDCLKVLRTMPANSIDSIVTDPPYGLKFMGKKWDYDVPSVEIWAECLRVLKPGGYLLAFAGTRTQHRMCCRIEDAGFEIRDMIAWVYGSGFPKSLDVSKAIESGGGPEAIRRMQMGESYKPSKRGRVNYDHGGGSAMNGATGQFSPATDAAKHWDGWGTALKPALEPITMARKPLIGTVAENVLTHGTGGINVGGCRVGSDGGGTHCTNRSASGKCLGHGNAGRSTSGETFHGPDSSGGRWPANLIHDGETECFGDFARFFYCAKASKHDRNEGLEAFPTIANTEIVGRDADSAGINNARAGAGRTSGAKNPHPTVKPTELMRYLCRLVTPKGGIVLDPFMGSGSTGKAAKLEKFRFIGIELDEQFVKIAKARIDNANA